MGDFHGQMRLTVSRMAAYIIDPREKSHIDELTLSRILCKEEIKPANYNSARQQITNDASERDDILAELVFGLIAAGFDKIVLQNSVYVQRIQTCFPSMT